MSPQSKSFVVLAILAVVGAFVVVILATSPFSPAPANYYQAIDYNQESKNTNTASAHSIGTPDIKAADTAGWKEYVNQELGIKFLYNPAWKITAPKQQYGFTTIQIDPGSKYYNFTIYVSPNDYAGTQGFDGKQMAIGGKDGLNIQNQVYAVKGDKNFYTFDVGQSLSLEPDFKALVASVNWMQ